MKKKYIVDIPKNRVDQLIDRPMLEYLQTSLYNYKHIQLLLFCKNKIKILKIKNNREFYHDFVKNGYCYYTFETTEIDSLHTMVVCRKKYQLKYLWLWLVIALNLVWGFIILPPKIEMRNIIDFLLYSFVMLLIIYRKSLFSFRIKKYIETSIEKYLEFCIYHNE